MKYDASTLIPITLRQHRMKYDASLFFATKQRKINHRKTANAIQLFYRVNLKFHFKFTSETVLNSKQI